MHTQKYSSNLEHVFNLGVRYNLMPHRVYIKDIESSRNVSVITSSVQKKHFIQAHGQKYIYISISLEYINT